MEQFTTHVQYLVLMSQKNSLYLLTFIGGMWAINILNWSIGSPLLYLGLVPRTAQGLIGILFSPIIHGNANHLFFNSVPLFLLANFVMLEGVGKFYIVTGAVMLIGGSLVWLFGRHGNHVGASGVILGYWAYLLFNAMYSGTLLALILGGVVIYYFGSMALSMVPSDEKESWEGHLFGAVAGAATAYFL